MNVFPKHITFAMSMVLIGYTGSTLAADSHSLTASSTPKGSVLTLTDADLGSVHAGGLAVDARADSRGIRALSHSQAHVAETPVGTIGAGAAIACCGSSTTSVTSNGKNIANVTIPLDFVGASVSIGLSYSPKGNSRRGKNRRR